MWTVVTLNAIVTAELNALPDDMLARFTRTAELIQAYGIERVREPHVKHVEGRLWEIQLSGRGGIARAFYVTASGKRVVIVRVFTKKTQKTPRSEIDLALERARELK